MEHPEQACRACGEQAAEFLFMVETNRVVRCRKCTHVYLNIVHTAESIRRMYEHYATNWGKKQYFEGIDDTVTRNLDDYLSRCRQLQQSGSGALRLLDIGSGDGTLLSRALKQGFECEGVEISKPLAVETSSRLGCSVYTDFLTTLPLPAARFDVITMYDLIEHLQDPAVELDAVRRLLKPGGIVFMLTPNDGALLRRVARFAYRASIRTVEKPMRRLYYVHHLSYFTAASLNTLLDRAGFEGICVETRNQELSRLMLTRIERAVVRTIFSLSDRLPFAGGKIVAWASRKR
jgi:2-polyprenyl-3-methyl-5-hydroxy-6-metoxy-1,4-benzoquinol methylase